VLLMKGNEGVYVWICNGQIGSSASSHQNYKRDSMLKVEAKYFVLCLILIQVILTVHLLQKGKPKISFIDLTFSGLV
jgi:hypothetical protein